MTLTLDLPDVVAAALQNQAEAEGSQPEEVAESAIIALLREKQPQTLIGLASSVVAARDAELIAAFRTSRA
jgi:hypothetical protein